MARIFRYEDWASAHAPAPVQNPQTEVGDAGLLKPVPFRQRLQSLPLICRENDIFRPSQNTTDDGKKSGGFKGLLRKASVSMKNRQRRFSHMSSGALGEEKSHLESPWRRLKTATSFHRHSRAMSVNLDMEGPFESYDEDMSAPIPGSGNRPPRIPRNGGWAARQNAALHNGIGCKQDGNLYLTHLNASAEGDRESAIAMPFDIPDQDPDQTEPEVEAQSPEASRAAASTTINRDFIADLPHELAIQVLSHVDTKTLRRLSLVSRRWYNLAHDQHVWRQIFLREETKSYATGKPIPLGAGLGLPATGPDNDWMALSKARHQLRDNWENGECDAHYLHGHIDSIYCVQFDE